MTDALSVVFLLTSLLVLGTAFAVLTFLITGCDGGRACCEP